MIYEVETKIKKEVFYIDCDIGVRYWEDSKINHEQDDEHNPIMPLIDKKTNSWKPLIALHSGQIVNWQKGNVAEIHYKVCDNGTYRLLDDKMNIVIEKDGYVPDMLGDMGDYVVMSIDTNGFIKNFYVDLTYWVIEDE